jgi:hypothetical protein
MTEIKIAVTFPRGEDSALARGWGWVAGLEAILGGARPATRARTQKNRFTEILLCGYLRTNLTVNFLFVKMLQGELIFLVNNREHIENVRIQIVSPHE